MKRFLPVIILSLLIFSCSKEEEEEEYPFDQSPYVEFEDLIFRDNSGEPDVMELSFIVWDREGDIGLGYEDIDFPFHRYNIITDTNDEPVKFENTIEAPFYSVPMNLLYDDLGEPVQLYYYKNKVQYSDVVARNGEFSCDEHIILYDRYYDPYDTLFGYENEYFYNLNISFYEEEGSELSFQEIFDSNDCNIGNFNAKLYDISDIDFTNPLDGNPFKVERRNKYSWKVTYLLRSSLWRLVFLDNSLEIRFSLDDRELNESNIASSGLVTLEEITVE